MDPTRFDAFSRTLGQLRSRRGLTRGVGRSALAGALGLLGAAAPAAAGCAKKCGPCQRCKHGRCKANKKLNNMLCNGDGRCLNGRCNPKPNCTPASQGCTSGNPGICCSGVCGFGQDPRCVRGDTGAKCLTGSDCISGQCIGYRCQGQVDCATAVEGTICAMDRACHFSQCLECWNWQDDGCCDVERTALSCVRNAICQAGQCLSCPAAQQCDGRCLGVACSDQCYKSCTVAGDCCGELTCQPMPEQGNPDQKRCAPA